jgi:hypothetical protein
VEGFKRAEADLAVAFLNFNVNVFVLLDIVIFENG